MKHLPSILTLAAAIMLCALFWPHPAMARGGVFIGGTVLAPYPYTYPYSSSYPPYYPPPGYVPPPPPPYAYAPPPYYPAPVYPYPAVGVGVHIR